LIADLYNNNSQKLSKA